MAMYQPAFDPDMSAKTRAELPELKGEAASLADTIFGHSPFLAAIARRAPEFAHSVLTHSKKSDFEDHFENILSALAAPRPATETDEAFDAGLRQAKARVAFLVACADVSRAWPLEDVTAALSRFANLSLSLALARAVHKRWRTGELMPPPGFANEQDTEISHVQDCGYFMLGLGKLGGNELNYSSDIDLVALYDPRKMTYQGRRTLSDCCIKITQDIVRHMDMRSMYGYVFRVDLRLRPDPGATPVALTVDAAMSYYHSIAVNWERAAMIKASFAAGDEGAANEYLAELKPWVWRRNIDYVALQDIAAIKNQINRHHDTDHMGFYGYDVKLGRGGIREIEFYAQINQLLHGGRAPGLHTKSTLKAIEELVDMDLVSAEDATVLRAAYRFLRTVEHRLQMTNDEQTHRLPEQQVNMQRAASFMGYGSIEAFKADLEQHTAAVSALYDALLPEHSDTSASPMSEAELKKSLLDSGFEDTDASYALIEGWQYGRYRALKTERARRLLWQCIPALLDAYAQSPSPDTAIIRFDQFLSTLPSGVQLFSMLQANPALLGLLARVTSLAPALSSILAKHPTLWDAVISAQFYEPVSDTDTLKDELMEQLGVCRDFQDVLDYTRRFAAEYHFRTGVHLLQALAGASETGKNLSCVADAVLQTLIPAVERQFADKHGTFGTNHSGLSVLALGKYGGQELTHTSDLDIVFIYDTSAEHQFSDGEKPLSPSVYYSRLAQHVLTAVTALTPEGRLFDVDTRLRPSGTQGPVACSLSAFAEYYSNSAWTWEFLALTRARVIYTNDTTRQKLEATVEDALIASPIGEKLQVDAAEMREKLRDQFYKGNPWDVKHAPGGLVDIEFTYQYLALKHKDALLPLPTGVPECLDALETNGFLTSKNCRTLKNGYKFQRYIQSLVRLSLEKLPETEQDIPTGLLQIMKERSGGRTNHNLIAEVKRIQKQCYSVFTSIMTASYPNKVD